VKRRRGERGEITYVQRLDVPVERMAIFRAWCVDQVLRATDHLVYDARCTPIFRRGATAERRIQIGHSYRLQERLV
jgi:hypothetical protein